MNSMEMFRLLGDVDPAYVKEAQTPRRSSGLSARWKRAVAAAAALVLLAGIGAGACALAMTYRYNAAVGYLRSLGIEAQDLSDYSRQEVREAARWLRADEPAVGDVPEKYMALYDKIHPAVSPPPAPSDRPAAVTSDDVRRLTPTMTAQEVMDTLGQTQDIGSGFLILLYQVDGDYTLTIPFAGLDAQLGVTGETLLQALQPKE